MVEAIKLQDIIIYEMSVAYLLSWNTTPGYLTLEDDVPCTSYIHVDEVHEWVEGLDSMAP